MIKQFLMICIGFLIVQNLFSQSRTATVNSGSHLIKTTDWSKFKTANILVEKLDGSKKQVYMYSTVRPTNPNAMYVEGLEDDFEQGTPVKVYVLKPRVVGFKSNPILAKVNSGAHLIKTTDWTTYNSRTILVEEVNGLNQNVYTCSSARAINPNAMFVDGIDEDYEQNTNVYVYIIENLEFINGNAGLGTPTTGTHKLAVEGTIGAREIKVEAGAWSDFVFEKGYNLKDLEAVETYIKKNKHLLDIPSEKEVLENGIQLGNMDAKLLQKIEELTLYIIEINKEVKTLKQENSVLKEKIEKVESEQ